MNYCMLLIKFAQLVTSIVIGIILCSPYNLKANAKALKGTEGPSAKLDARHLICSKPEKFFDQPFSKNFSKTKDEIDFWTYDIIRLRAIRTTLSCLEQGNKQEQQQCMCWDKAYQLIAVVLVSVSIAILSLCDIISICAAEEKHHTRKSLIHACISFSSSLIFAVIWVVCGGILLHFFTKRWPYVYEIQMKNGDIVYDKFFLIPTAWTVAVYMCFSFAILIVLEGIVHICEESCHKDHPLNLFVIDDYENHDNETV